MKHIYLNLMIWAVSLCSMSLTAQTVADEHKAMLPQSGKLRWEKPVKAMIKPQMPVTRIPHDRMNLPVTSRTASLRAATAQAMQLDSVIFCNAEGEKQTKYIYQYDTQGNTTESTLYLWDNPAWSLNSRYLYEYDEIGNCISSSYYTFNNSEWRLYWKDVYTYDNSNNRTSTSYNYYNNEGEMTSQFYYEYNTKGAQTKYEYKELRDGVLTLVEQGQYVYDSNNQRTHSETKKLDENGEWYFTSYYNYAYDTKGRQTLYEQYSWNATKEELYLTSGSYFEYDNQGHRTYYEDKYWNGTEYEKIIEKYAYDEEDWLTYSEYLRDIPSYYSHSIETYSYADDKLTGTSFLRDTTIQSDGSKSVSLTSWDYTYDSKGQLLSMEGFNVDPKTEERASKLSVYEYTYDSQGRTLSVVSTYYEDNIIESIQKSEYERPDEGNCYIMNNYKQDLETNEWILTSRYQYEYEKTGEYSYYYLHSNWDMTTEEWIVSYGYKYEYEKDGNNYTQISYNWDTNSNDWMITYGYKYIDETDGESYTRINASYDVENSDWVVSSSYKTEVTEGNPKIIKQYYLPENDLENWQLDGISYYYYSESSVANESIDAVDARIYTRPGTIHVDMEGKAALSVYAANGACCYQSSISGSTDVSNLQRGIYFVVLQSDSGTKKVKVLVK